MKSALLAIVLFFLPAQLAAQGGPQLLFPANGETNVSINPTFTWTSALGAQAFTLQVSPDPAFGNLIIDIRGIEGESMQVSGLEYSTMYYWRVQVSNSSGGGRFSEVNSFTTMDPPPPAPVAPSLVSPENGAADVSVSVSLVWDSVSTAATYHAQVSTESDFSVLVADESGITGTSLGVSGLLNGTVYYWRVSATNAGGTSDFSGAYSFTTAQAPPSVPVLASPPDGATDVSVDPVLSWYACTNASSYSLQVSTESDFSTVLYEQTLTDSLTGMTGLANSTLYYWRVRAEGAVGASEYSAVQSFMTVAGEPALTAPAAPALVAPEDSATGVALDAVLSWNSSQNAESYSLQVSVDPAFSSYVYNEVALIDTSMQMAGLAHNTLYYWRVNAMNAGGTGDYSAIWSFVTVVAMPAMPQLNDPGDGAIDVPTELTLSWAGSEGATSYNLQVATDTGFVNIVSETQLISETSQQVTGLENNRLYYWRVSATNESGTSDYSPTWNFMTIIAAPDTPSPEDASVDVSIDATLSWSAVEGAMSYSLEVSEDAGFTSVVFSQSGITETSQQVPGLGEFTQYFWRVTAASNTAFNASPMWSFTTGGPTSVEQLQGAIPTAFELQQNYPNPFNPATTIRFSVPKESRVVLSVYNSLGEEIDLLVDDTYSAGTYQIQWTPRGISSGVYFYRIRTNEFSSTRKLLLLR